MTTLDRELIAQYRAALWADTSQWSKLAEAGKIRGQSEEEVFARFFESRIQKYKDMGGTQGNRRLQGSLSRIQLPIVPRSTPAPQKHLEDAPDTPAWTFERSTVAGGAGDDPASLEPVFRRREKIHQQRFDTAPTPQTQAAIAFMGGLEEGREKTVQNRRKSKKRRERKNSSSEKPWPGFKRTP